MCVLIEASDLRKTYTTRSGQAVEALRGVSLRLEKGEMLCVTGPSGSGKSTLLHILGCVEKPTGGACRVLGRDLAILSARQAADMRGKEIGFIMQDFGLLYDRTVLDNALLPFLFGKTPLREAREKARAALASVGLGDACKRLPYELSGGQRQRVAVARALAGDCRLLLADEPTGALDAATGHALMELFQGLCAKGIAVVLVTHNLALQPLCTRSLRLLDGAAAPAESAPASA